MEDLAIVAKALRGYKQSLAQGRTDLANQYADEVDRGISALTGITGIQQTQQRMELERAQERHRVALRPHEVVTARAGAEQAELTTEQLQMTVGEQRKTIESLEKQLAELGMPGTTVEALERGEEAREVVARREEEVPAAKAKAERAKFTLEEVAAQVQTLMREEELKREIPAKTVAAREEELETVVAKADYEQLSLKWLTEMDVPEHDARTKSMMFDQAAESSGGESYGGCTAVQLRGRC
jgi:hypothetical protein